MKLLKFKIWIIVAFLMPLFIFQGASADIINQTQIFKVNSKYDRFSRTSLGATLRTISDHAYFYVEDKYWEIGHIWN